MAESQYDDAADALARMAAGDVAPSEHEPESEPPPTPASAPVRPVKPAAARPGVVRQAAPVSKPAAPAPTAPVRTRPAAPVLSSAPPPPAAPPAPAGPVIATPSARKVRPVAPTIRSVAVPNEQSQPEVDGDQSTALSGETSEVIDDDEAAIMVPAPAPDAAVIEYRSRTAADARAKMARKKNLEIRRTFIPILLTSGTVLIGFASLRFVSGPDSTLSDLDLWIPIVLVLLAVVFFAVAVVNMLSVKDQLKQS